MRLGQSVDLTLVSLSAMPGYVNDNDVRHGLKVAHRDPKSSKVTARGALHLVGRRRLGRSARLRLLFKDGAIPSVTIILRIIFATILVNGLYTGLSNPLVSALHFFDDVPVVFNNLCRSHAGRTYLVHKAVLALMNANQLVCA